MAGVAVHRVRSWVLLIVIFFATGSGGTISAQGGSFSIASDITYTVTKFDGGAFVGRIISHDSHEVVVDSEAIGVVAIPRHEIESIVPLGDRYVGSRGTDPDHDGDPFATRYVLTTNGLPIRSGDHYISLNIYGPELQLAVLRNVGVGLLTSWAGTPLVLSTKYSLPVAPQLHLGAGALFASGTYVEPTFVAALPFAAVTIGSRATNVNLAAGYGVATAFDPYLPFNDGGRILVSVAARAQLVRNLSIVLDSAVVPADRVAIIAFPVVRWNSGPDRAWQFGVLGVVDDNFEATPIPALQWYRSID